MKSIKIGENTVINTNEVVVLNGDIPRKIPEIPASKTGYVKKSTIEEYIDKALDVKEKIEERNDDGIGVADIMPIAGPIIAALTGGKSTGLIALLSGAAPLLDKVIDKRSKKKEREGQESTGEVTVTYEFDDDSDFPDDIDFMDLDWSENYLKSQDQEKYRDLPIVLTNPRLSKKEARIDRYKKFKKGYAYAFHGWNENAEVVPDKRNKHSRPSSVVNSTGFSDRHYKDTYYMCVFIFKDGDKRKKPIGRSAVRRVKK